MRLQIADLNRSLQYYQSVLGLIRVAGRADGDAALGATDGTPLVLLEERSGARPVPRRGRLGLYHFALLLPDRPSLGRFVRHLAELGAPAGSSDHLVSEAIYLQDPDGLGIEVYADRPRGSWQYRDGELQMDTRSLDLSALLREAGGQGWDGLPPGSRVGHLHLHVGDLSAARSFYQHGLGLEPTVSSYPGALFLAAGGYHHHLGLNTWAAGAEPAGDGDARLVQWELRAPSASGADAIAENLRVSGFEVRRESGAYLARDPWGVGLRIIAE